MHARGVESVWGMWVFMRTYALGVRVLVHVHGVCVICSFLCVCMCACVWCGVSVCPCLCAWLCEGAAVCVHVCVYTHMCKCSVCVCMGVLWGQVYALFILSLIPSLL